MESPATLLLIVVVVALSSPPDKFRPPLRTAALLASPRSAPFFSSLLKKIQRTCSAQFRPISSVPDLSAEGPLLGTILPLRDRKGGSYCSRFWCGPPPEHYCSHFPRTVDENTFKGRRRRGSSLLPFRRATSPLLLSSSERPAPFVQRSVCHFFQPNGVEVFPEPKPPQFSTVSAAGHVHGHSSAAPGLFSATGVTSAVPRRKKRRTPSLCPGPPLPFRSTCFPLPAG